jgi:hypothetical protein
MYLIQVLLPLYDNNKQVFQKRVFDNIRDNLKDVFGGVTIYRNSPAEGVWSNETGTDYDELITAEIITNNLDKALWQQFKHELEHIFKQKEIMMRCIEFQKL